MLNSQRPTKESPALTLLHLSDIQFGPKHRFGRLGLGGADEHFDSLLGRVCDDLDYLKRSRGIAPDVVTLTGDLAEMGMKREFDDVLNFIDGLAKHLDLGRERILVVPGNHDINRKKCEAYFNDCAGDGELPQAPYWPKWRPYVDFFSTLYANIPNYRFTEREPWTLYSIPELNTVFVGLNSTLRESHQPGDHYGWVGEGQCRWFRSQLESYRKNGWLRIGLIHHNVMRRAVDDDENLHDADDLQKYLGSELHLILHGHTHLGRVETLGNLPVFATGSAAVYFEQRPQEVPNQYQVIQVHRDGFWCGARQYTVQRKAWSGDTAISDGNDWFIERKCDLSDIHALFPARTRTSSQAPPTDDGPLDEVEDLDVRGSLEVREANDLLSSVMEVCALRPEGRGIKVERVRHPGPWGHYARVFDPGSAAYALGAVAGVITVERLKLWIQDVHEPFRRHPAQQGARTELVVACETAIPDSIKNMASQHGVQVHRWIDYQRILDVDGYRADLQSRLNQDRTYPANRYLEQRMTDWTPDTGNRDVKGAADWMVERLRDPDQGAFILVLGPAGVGKTFLLRQAAQRLSNAQQLVTPLLIDLRHLESAQDVPQLVATHFARRGLVFPPRAFERELREGRLALLFDGFDELHLRVRSAAITAHFERIINAARDQAKIVVTSRTEYFLTDGQVEDLVSRTPTNITALAGVYLSLARRHLVGLKRFVRSDVERYLVNALGEAAGQKRFVQMRDVHDLVGMATNPRMLGFLVDIPDAQIEAARRRKDALTSAELYRLVIHDNWLKGEADRLKPPGAAPGPTQESLRDAATRLALHLWTHSNATLLSGDLGAHVGDLLKRLCDDDLDMATSTLRSRTLLTRTADGQISFVHQTVLEWLVATAIANDIKNTGQSEHLGQGRLNKFVIDFLRECVGDDSLARWAEAALAQSQTDRRAENARDALRQLGREARQRADLRGQDLRGQDLGGQDLRAARLDDADMRGMRLVGRDLTGASLVRANLSHADLSDCNLVDADLTGADLSFAKFYRATIQGLKLDGAWLLGASFLGTRGAPSIEVPQQLPPREQLHSITDGSPASCHSVAFGCRGCLLASGHADGSIRLWDAKDGRLLRVLAGHAGSVACVAFSPDGQTLASGADDKTVRTWSVETGTPIRIFHGHTRGVGSIAYSNDGRILASGAHDRTICLRFTDTGESLGVLLGHDGPIVSLSFSPDGEVLASGSRDKTVQLWSVANRTSICALSGHKGGVWSVSFAPDGRTIASGADHGIVRIWSAETGKQLRILVDDPNPIRGVCYSPDGRTLLTGSDDQAVRLWNVETGKLLRVLRGHRGAVRSVAFSPDGLTIASGATGNHDNTVRLWNTETGTQFREASRTEFVGGVAFSPDGRTIASGANDRIVRLWAVDSGRLLRTIAGHKGSVLSVSFSPGGRTIATGASDKTVRLWNVATGNEVRVLSGHQAYVQCVSFSPDGRTLASGADDKTVHLWDVDTGKLRQILWGHDGPVWSVCFSPDGNTIASGGDDRSVRLWPAEGGAPRHILAGHEGPVKGVSFSPDGGVLISGSSDHTIRMWAADSGKLIQVFTGHEGPIWSLSFSPDGHTLASGASDKTVCLWDAATGKLVRTLVGHTGYVWSAAFSPNGYTLLTGSSDGTTRIWDVHSGQCLAALLATERGTIVFRPDGSYKTTGEFDGHVWHTIGLHRYEIGELDAFTPGGLRLPEETSILDIKPSSSRSAVLLKQ